CPVDQGAAAVDSESVYASTVPSSGYANTWMMCLPAGTSTSANDSGPMLAPTRLATLASYTKTSTSPVVVPIVLPDKSTGAVNVTVYQSLLSAVMGPPIWSAIVSVGASIPRSVAINGSA